MMFHDLGVKDISPLHQQTLRSASLVGGFVVVSQPASINIQDLSSFDCKLLVTLWRTTYISKVVIPGPAGPL